MTPSPRAVAAPGAIVAALITLVCALPATAAVVPMQCRPVGDSCASGGPGSGNRTIDPGETGSMQLRVRNNGNSTVRMVRAFLTTTAPGVTLLTDTFDFPDLAARTESEAIAPIQILQIGRASCRERVSVLV